METKTEIFIGIDVSKGWLDIYDGTKGWRIENSAKATLKFANRFAENKPSLVVVESTGGYERVIVQACWDAAIPVAMVNPRQTKRFAQGLAVEAKTDQIDAKMLQKFAAMVRPKATLRPEPEVVQLQALLDRRRQIMEMIVKEKNRAKAPLASKQQLLSIKRVLKVLEKELKEISVQADKTIKSSDFLSAKQEVLISEHGVGETFSLTLLGDVPELGTLNRAKIGALIGVAPLNNQSGTKDSRRFIRGGRKHVRQILYMATVAAIRRSPALKPYFLRLVKRGKPKMIALIACMRKLLITLNAKMRAFLLLRANNICLNQG